MTARPDPGRQSPFASLRALLPVLLLVLQILATTTVAWLGSDDLRYVDEHDYHGIAQRLNAGQGFVDREGQATAYRAPGYPVLLAAIYHVVDRPLAAKLMNGVWLLLATLLLIQLVGPAVPSARWSVPLLVLLNPLMIYSAGTLYPQVFALFLFVLSLVLALRGAGRWGVGAVVLAGGVYGLLILTVSSFLLLLPLLLAGLVWLWPGSLLRRLLQAGVFALVVVAAMAPWIARNYAVFGALVPVSTNGGINLLIGNSENTRPNNGVNADIWDYQMKTVGLGEVETDARYREFAVAWIKAHPAEAAKLYLQKTLNYFNFRNEVATSGQRTPWGDYVLFCAYYPVLLIVLWRLVNARRDPPRRVEWLLFALYVGNAFLSAIFFTRLRFRVPFDALLVASAAYGIEWLRSARRPGASSPR